MRDRADHSRRAAGRTAFTLGELVIGIAMTAMVGAALAAFTMSVSQAWTANERIEASATIANGAMARTGALFRRSLAVGAYRPGSLDNSDPQSAAVLVWRADLNGDGRIQLSELELLVFDPVTRRIDRYVPLSLKDDADWPVEKLLDDASIDEVMAAFDRVPLAGRIVGMSVYRRDDGVRRAAVELRIRVAGIGDDLVVAATTACRSTVTPGN
jgi:type II secretory pathway component PulJ